LAILTTDESNNDIANSTSSDSNIDNYALSESNNSNTENKNQL
jgi:hypothetical protein